MLPDRVAVACPGPGFHPKRLPPGFRVAAVNHTLLVLDRCDWWICYDCPHEVHHQCKDKLIALRPTIVTMSERIEGWQQWFRDLGLQQHQWPAFEVVDWGPLWFKLVMNDGPRFTSTMAISWALRRRVRHLHYVGANMGGRGYYDEKTMHLSINRDKQPHIWQDRWEKERLLLGNIQRECAKRGVMAITGMPWGDEVATARAR